MTRLLAFTLMLAVVLFALCGCVYPPYAKQVIPSGSNAQGNLNTDVNSPATTRKLYVSGAVEHDGYIDIPLVTDYKTVLQIVGALPCTAVPANANTLIGAQIHSLVVDFVCDGRVFSSVNVNGDYVANRVSVDGVSSVVVNKLADYIALNGAIRNRAQLKSALNYDYADNFYKFYIDAADYA